MGAKASIGQGSWKLPPHLQHGASSNQGFGPAYLVEFFKVGQVTWFCTKLGQLTWI